MRTEQYLIIGAVAVHVRVGYTAQWDVQEGGTTIRGYAKGGNEMGRTDGFFNIPWPGKRESNSGIDILFVTKEK